MGELMNVGPMAVTQLGNDAITQVNGARREWGLRVAVWMGLRCLRGESERGKEFALHSERGKCLDKTILFNLRVT